MRFLVSVLSLLSFLTLIGCSVLGGAIYYAHTRFHEPLSFKDEQVFLIPNGTSLVGIINKLESQKLIDPTIYDGWVFRAAVHYHEQQNRLQAGEYLITPDMSMADIVELFMSGKVILKNVTIPEGLTSYEIVQLLNSNDKLAGEVITEIPEEGFLLPETYSYNSGQTRKDIIEWMQRDMRKAIDELWDNRAANLPIQSKEELLTLASIIEKETGVPEERKRVAGVFVNRLRKGMRLQTDPTVIYAITQGQHKNDGMGPLGRKIYKKDLKIDSPYNTYLYAGLPPGPIANPGYASLEAALHPEEHNYLYFVATADGGHKFATNLKDHNRNVAEWRKSR